MNAIVVDRAGRGIRDMLIAGRATGVIATPVITDWRGEAVLIWSPTGYLTEISVGGYTFAGRFYTTGRYIFIIDRKE